MDKTSSKNKDLIQYLYTLENNPSVKKESVMLLIEIIDELTLREKELAALIKGAKVVLEQKSFHQSARSIFDHCRKIIGATSGYVALLNENGDENEVLFLEAGGLPCDVDPALPMPIRGLRAEAYHHNKAVYHNDFMNSEWIKYMPKGHVLLKNVMFAPLILDGRTVGIMGLANKESDFTDNDAKMASGFGELAAIALQNSKLLDERIKAETKREMVIKELEQALAQVKQLSGLLPICMMCKKIRDDKGYWNQLENYIEKHSGAQFTHSLCDECTDRHFPPTDQDSA